MISTLENNLTDWSQNHYDDCVNAPKQLTVSIYNQLSPIGTLGFVANKKQIPPIAAMKPKTANANV